MDVELKGTGQLKVPKSPQSVNRWTSLIKPLLEQPMHGPFGYGSQDIIGPM